MAIFWKISKEQRSMKWSNQTGLKQLLMFTVIVQQYRELFDTLYV